MMGQEAPSNITGTKIKIPEIKPYKKKKKNSVEVKDGRTLYDLDGCKFTVCNLLHFSAAIVSWQSTINLQWGLNQGRSSESRGT